MKLRILAAIAISAVTLAAYSSSAHAATVSANATVTINYTGACTLSTANATMAYRAADVNTSADVTVNCNSGLAWALTADNGQNVSAALRRGTLSGGFLTYRLFKDSGLTAEIAAAGANAVVSSSGTGANQITTMYYAVKSADNATPPAFGAYIDTLGYTLTF